MTDAPSRQLLLVDDDEAKRYLLAPGCGARATGWSRRRRAGGPGAGRRGRAGGARRQPAGHQRHRGLPADQERAQTAAIPVIQVSATAVGIDDRARGLTEGADAYLIDPTEPVELLATVTAALRYPGPASAPSGPPRCSPP